MSKTKIVRGLGMTSILLLSVSICAATIMEYYASPLDELLGTQSYTYETEYSEEAEDSWNFKSDLTSGEIAFNAYKNFALEESKEAFALLKNESINDSGTKSLPLQSSSPKVTLFGGRSYAPVYGNSAGSIADKGTVENGNTITEAFTAAGLDLNPSMLSTYESFFSALTWGGSGFGAVPPEYSDWTSTTDIPELSPSELAAINPDYASDYNEYSDAAIVVLGRPGGESKEYYLGEEGLADGVSTTTGNIMGLSTEEKEIIEEAKQCSDNVIVLINATNTMEFKELKDDEDIDSILWIGFPGAYGFHEVANTLLGKTNPSAALGDIHPTNGATSPAMQSFGNVPWANASDFNADANVNSYLIEAEGIYTGYRYYETRYYDIVTDRGSEPSHASAGTYTTGNGELATTDGTWDYNQEVVYPFGYGLSYTTFDYHLDSVNVLGSKETAEVTVTVTNTGDVAGKTPVQIYAQAPYTDYDAQNDVEKSAIQLLDFEKSETLAAGESQTITMNVDLANLASYDYKNAKTYIVDPGDYYLTVGSDSHDALNNILAYQGYTVEHDGMDYDGDASEVYEWNWGGDVDAQTFSTSKYGAEITNQLSDGDYSMDLNSFEGYEGSVTYLSRDNWDSTFPESYEGLSATGRLKELLSSDYIALETNEDTSEFEWGVDSDLSINDLKGAEWDDERWDELVDKVTIDEFLSFAANAFHNIAAIESVGYLGNNADDGPGGSDSHYLNEGTYQGEAWSDASDYENLGTRVCPSQQNLAYTWNKVLAYENGELIIGETSLIFNLPIMIGPGANIHRHGYNGRGGEYYSEDPVLSGYIGSAEVQGAQSKGCLVNIKHAAFNDQEINRSGVAVFMNEQKARELELRNLDAMFEAKGKPAAFEGNAEYDDTYVDYAYGVMSSYNRIGAVASSANYAVMVNIMRDEWGFKGYNVTDFTGVALKASPKESILAGTTAFCGFGTSVDYWSASYFEHDYDQCAAIKKNIKYILYSLANSNALNGVNSSTVKVNLMTSWRALYIALIAVFGVATAACLVLYVIFEIQNGKKEAE